MSLSSETSAAVVSLGAELKAQLVNGRDTWSTIEIPEIGLRPVRMSDGPSGVRGTAWDEREAAVSFPSGVALGATFDSALLHRVGVALGEEARARGVHVVLGPTVNLQQFPHAGRHFEYLSYDPYLSSVLAVAYVRGLQSRGVAATPKHFVANDFEKERHVVNVVVGERALRESYLLPFEAVVRDAGTWALMAAYNAVGGTPMTANDRLLSGVLIDEWGFDGVTMSDWGAVYDGVASAKTALHLAMPGPDGEWGEPLGENLRTGVVAEADLDDKVARIVLLAERVGARSGLDTDVAFDSSTPDLVAPSDVAYEAAAASIVLLSNDGILPLVVSDIRRLAVIGPNAVQPFTQGGGSAHVNAGQVLGPADALRERLCPSVEVVGHRGCEHRRLVPPLGTGLSSTDPYSKDAGVGLEYLDPTGRVVHRETRSGGHLVWFGDLPDGLNRDMVDRVRISADVKVDEPGEYEIGVAGMTSQRLDIDGATVLDVVRSATIDVEAFHRPEERRLLVEAPAPGHVFRLVVEQVLYTQRTMGLCRIGVRPKPTGSSAEIDGAVRLAAGADAVVLVVGTNDEVESEGFDRDSLRLPGDQEELIARVCEANPRTVVVINSGAPVNVGWRALPAAVMVNWFGGQWAGPALAAVLLGDMEPAGRLPMPWPTGDGIDPPRPVAGTIDYGDEPLTHSRDSKIAFPFGFGLGYTEWEYGDVEVLDHGNEPGPGSCRFGDDRAIWIGVPITNIGDRFGQQVVQAYGVTRDGTARRLIGFTKVGAEPGATVRASLEVPARMLCTWDVASATWVLDAGLESIVIASHAGDTTAAIDASVIIDAIRRS